tara:strand:+ start:3670 stop:3990 length:321 start_codon:yes stop_codon:yes gene_type:complete
MGYPKPAEYTLLSAVTSTGAGTAINSQRTKGWTFVITAASVTTGGTVEIEAELNGSWITIHSEAVTADGDTVVRDEHGHYTQLRGNVTARTDGTYTVTATGSTFGY